MTDCILVMDREPLTRTSVAEFLGNNEFDEAEVREIKASMFDQEPYFGGGGAQPHWVLIPAELWAHIEAVGKLFDARLGA